MLENATRLVLFIVNYYVVTAGGRVATVLVLWAVNQLDQLATVQYVCYQRSLRSFLLLFTCNCTALNI